MRPDDPCLGNNARLLRGRDHERPLGRVPQVRAPAKLCWAHLARNFTALSESREEETARLGRAGVALCRRLFHHWHRFHAAALSRSALLQRLGPARRWGERLTTELLGAEDRRARGPGQDFARQAGALWNFAEREGVEPTNNTAERGLRKRGLWRKTRFGSDSAGGVRFVERILSVVESCRQQRRSAFDFLRDALLAHRCGASPPLLFS